MGAVRRAHRRCERLPARDRVFHEPALGRAGHRHRRSAIFVRRDAFERAGRFPSLELMEDIALSRLLKRVSRPLCLADKAVTSGRRWERHGVLRTVLLMGWLRLAFFFGAAPAKLARLYDGDRG